MPARVCERCVVLRRVAWLGVAWLGLAWHAWRGLAGLGMAWLGVAWFGLAWCGVAWQGCAWGGCAWRGCAWRVDVDGPVFYKGFALDLVTQKNTVILGIKLRKKGQAMHTSSGNP